MNYQKINIEANMPALPHPLKKINIVYYTLFLEQNYLDRQSRLLSGLQSGSRNFVTLNAQYGSRSG